MTFGEALAIFCNRYCRLRAERDEPVMLSEFAEGLTVMMVSLLESLEGDNRAVLREAIKSALDSDAPVSKREMN